ncbi:conserved hypothetical protein [Theileria equi strain WA]|uniref:RING-type domain-containing protein n=1 Tax=Theileria equi strain WA TaxID=1537102 RepID=L1LFW2_THEEQ|nr:conserved hypothetical protein [Theileria equi strain WA]EKX74241.1 conserved hypothetical protein [Theileria equi strain WA]|eukprot:XP_004833693.1 conserved hypothetical protein [Theileria equi strain WA]
MTSFPLLHRIYPSYYYFCHVCNARRSENQVSTSDSGDITCLLCQSVGFVEKVTVGNQDGTMFHSGDTSGGSSNSRGNPTPDVTRLFASDPFTSVFGMPLNTFIQDVMQGYFGGSVSNVEQRNPLEMGFGSRDFSTIFGSRPIFTSYGGSRGRPFTARTPLFPTDLSRIMSSFISNPFDQQAMDQILQYVMDNDPNRYGSPPVAKDILNSLKVEVLTADTAKELGNCAVCTEDFRDQDKVHWLTEDKSLCGHAFHVDCIIPWLKEHNTCPVCRFELPTDDETYNKQREYLRTRIAEEVQRNANTPPSTSRNE